MHPSLGAFFVHHFFLSKSLNISENIQNHGYKRLKKQIILFNLFYKKKFREIFFKYFDWKKILYIFFNFVVVAKKSDFFLECSEADAKKCWLFKVHRMPVILLLRAVSLFSCQVLEPQPWHPGIHWYMAYIHSVLFRSFV